MSLPAFLGGAFALGRHTTSVVITPISVSGTTATAGSPVTVTGFFEGLDLEIATQTEDVRPVNAVRINNLKVGDGINATLNILRRNLASTDHNPLADIALNADYVRLVWTQEGYTYTLYATRGSMNSNVAGFGKQVASLQLLPADFGSSTFTRVVAA